jgi:serine/threonine-protein kinase
VSDQASGTILEGKYEILARLGAGGMGEVYRARHVHLGDQRVIKILRQDRMADPTAVQRFTQEARIATQIKHPNVAILYDFSRLPDGSFFMVWEHIEGEDVGNWLATKGPFPVPLAVELGIQALRGLEAVHGAGVIHRDIAPDNFMITRDRRGRFLLKIIDLGLAKALESSSKLEITEAGMFLGKLAYCSPEQAGALKDAPLDHRSDLYSVAAVLYEMICGKPPFDSESQHGLVLKRLTEPALPLRGRNPKVQVPVALEEVILKGLERDRERRWPDAVSFLQALVKVAEDLRKVATQEVPVGTVQSVLSAPTPPAVAPARKPSASELSREERLELLAQIDRAAKKVSESARLSELAQQALAAGRLEDASALAAQLESVNPRAAGLAELKARLAPASAPPPRPGAPAMPSRGAAYETADFGGPVRLPAPEPPPVEPEPPAPVDPELVAKRAEAEHLLLRYLGERKQQLAAFALDTLVELEPDHPRLAEFENAVARLATDADEQKKAEAALRTGRDAAARGDMFLARAQLDMVERHQGTANYGAILRAEIDAAERTRRDAQEISKRRERLESLLDSKRLKEAEEELTRLSEAGLAKVSVESYRLRVADIQAMAERESKAQAFEKRYRELVQAHDWFKARDLVVEFEKLAPDSPRPAQMFGEISRLEEMQRKQQGIDQGVQQIENFLRQRRVGEAEMALRILISMNPDHPQRHQFEQKIAALKRGV